MLNIVRPCRRIIEILSIGLLTIISCGVANAQDTLSVSFTQEPGTLVKQYFIDRYENVFMTKVPTRNMMKVGYSNSVHKGIGLNFGYEYKLLPSFSMEATCYVQTNYDNDGIYLTSFNKLLNRQNLFIGAKARWYFDMDKRIKNALNANNFSGKYVAVSYETATAAFYDMPARPRNRDILGIMYGFQSRFLNHGFLDFSVGIFHVRPNPTIYWRDEDDSNRFTRESIVFATQTSIGLAYGDWKKSHRPPLCEVLSCDEDFGRQFKVRFPEISLGLNRQSFRAEIALEQKLGKSPLTLNVIVGSQTYRSSSEGFSMLDFSLVSEVQLRYYALQKRRILKGKSRNNLSGLYGGPVLQYHYVYENFGRAYINKNLGGGVAAGYQERLFKNIYFDTALSYAIVDWNYNFEMRAKVGLGFAF